MANMIPDEIKNIDDLEKLSDKVEVIYDYIKYMREQLEFYSSAKRLNELNSDIVVDFHKLVPADGVTVGHAYTRRRGNVVEVEMEVTLDGSLSDWTPIIEGLPKPNHTVFSTADYWASSYTRPLRTAVSSSDGNVRIRYGGAGSYDIHFVYLI